MTARILIVINAVGCLILAAVIVLQWQHERELEGALDDGAEMLRQTEDMLDAQTAKCDALESDIALLKESITSATQALAERDGLLAARAADIEVLNARIVEAKVQLDQWEEAVQQRDQRIKSLEDALQATRARLDEAISQLKKASSQAE